MTVVKTAPGSADAVCRALTEKRIVVIPTDTVYGFSGVVPETDAAIRKIKGRSETKPFIRLIGMPEDILLYTDCKIPDALFALWPGAVTVIVSLKDGSGTAAFRCPGDSWLRGILNRCGVPVYSTSVNRSGQPVLYSVPAIEQEFGNDVALIVDDGEKPAALPSTIVDCTAVSGECRIVRQGSVRIDPRVCRSLFLQRE